MGIEHISVDAIQDSAARDAILQLVRHSAMLTSALCGYSGASSGAGAASVAASVRPIQPGTLVNTVGEAGDISPPWYRADGSEVSRKDLAALYALIGTGYGPGDGSSSFNLPNLKDMPIEEVFSEAPQPTNQIWCDKKRIWRAIVQTGTLSDFSGGQSSETIAHGLDIEAVIRLWGVITNGAGIFYTLDRAYPAADGFMCIALHINGANILITHKRDLDAYSGFVVVEYTRTSSAARSHLTTYSVPAILGR